MTARQELPDEGAVSVAAVSDNVPVKSLMLLFEGMTLREWWGRVRSGLSRPPDTAEYAWARVQVQRLWSPVCAVMIPVLFVLLMVVLAPRESVTRTITVTLEDPVAPVVLDEPDPLPQVDNQPETVVPDIMPEVGNSDDPQDELVDVNIFSAEPRSLDRVRDVTSALKFSGLVAGRSPGEIGALGAKFGAPAAADASVLLALRWLKKYQSPDGRWDANAGGGQGDESPTALTGLALLTFLSHGETLASKEFGLTVEKALKWLVSMQQADGGFAGRDVHDYAHPIAAYALCEGFGMTRIPMVGYAAEKAIVRIVRGQHGSGAWNYNLDASARDDLSYTSWCIQALKAAALVELQVEGLHAALRKARGGVMRMASETGRFGYTSSQDGTGGLTGAGVLSLQFLGAGNHAVTRRGVRHMQPWVCNWDRPNMKAPIYYWYYATQALFHAGDQAWHRWRNQFYPEVINHVIIVSQAIRTPDGQWADIGYWPPCARTEYARSYTYTTTMCALMLQVTHRFLGTYKASASEDSPEKDGFAESGDEIGITIL